MSNVPSELKYVASHEWLRMEDDGTITVGITDHAQEALGDIVYVELPDVGDTVAVDDEVAVVESVKAASDVYAPITGEVVAINEALEDDPEVINTDPYGEGWMYRIKPDNADDFDSLLSAEEYQADL
ncbi:glycine cleavage system protein GcvH [Psychrobacter sanguinis]|jgi:glycine cleavage system H protein|uniref:glycine cleavage system protein GcvH n=1 Tax=Psychrobacter sanguinis TaxID=861445 RepID=UPI00020C7ED4|nr:glycine cleavage system protein GcvH [Psychrobacter sanguinis]EGK10078.1 glycine cleavage system H protein [Psychrobacter sp. 1501(2011)]HBH34649.1 glycine cleavage system protein H [Psychrobacter sp.]MCC3307226.1 glycine cleavage system protein GcvH [Psychrobacter sanguinis]MCC3344994.1 glycine cleavage system protein GcvH [Psychrobacter sanguinis]MCD9152519.1 glycine cleavage system protein GcvH [Psychrobacter sanguinis]